MDLPLLVTPPGSEVSLPPEFDIPAGAGWRLAESLGPCLFVVLASADTFATSEPRTLIMCWDSDIVHFVESNEMSTRLHALHHVKRETANGCPVLKTSEIDEIWRGTDRAAGDAEVIIFKTRDGISFCGVGAESVPSSVDISRLVAKIPHI